MNAIEWINGKYDIRDDYSQQEAVTFDIEKPVGKKVVAVIGESGTGKTTLLKKWFPMTPITFGMSSNVSIFEIISEFTNDFEETSKLLFDVGLSSVPMWKNTPDELSNGEKMRFELAYKLANKEESIFIDEFTSMVDRQTAKNLCKNLNKLIKKYHKQIILVTCHYDFLEWLDVDMVVDTTVKKSMALELGKKISVQEWKSHVFQSMRGEHLASITI